MESHLTATPRNVTEDERDEIIAVLKSVPVDALIASLAAIYEHKEKEIVKDVYSVNSTHRQSGDEDYALTLTLRVPSNDRIADALRKLVNESREGIVADKKAKLERVRGELVMQRGTLDAKFADIESELRYLAG